MMSIIRRAVLLEVMPPIPPSAAAPTQTLQNARVAINGKLKQAGPAMAGPLDKHPLSEAPTATTMRNPMRSPRAGGTAGKLLQKVPTQAKAAKKLAKPGATPKPTGVGPESMVLRGILQESKMSRVINDVVGAGAHDAQLTAKVQRSARVNGNSNTAQKLVRRYMKVNGKHLVSALPDNHHMHAMKSARGGNALVATAQSILKHSAVARGSLLESFKSKRGEPIVKAGMDAYGRATKGNIKASVDDLPLGKSAFKQLPNAMPTAGYTTLAGAKQAALVKAVRRAPPLTGLQAMKAGTTALVKKAI